MTALIAATLALAGVGLDWARQLLIADRYQQLSAALRRVPLTYHPNQHARRSP